MTKQQQRKLIQSRLSSLSDEQVKEKSQKICELLLDEVLGKKPHIVMSYRAMKREVNLSMLNQQLEQAGVKVCYPKVNGETMDAWLADTYQPGAYGILEPVDGTLVQPQEIDVVLMPCVGYDTQGHRLGHGKGYYDKYLSQSDAYRIVVGFGEQQLNVVTTDEYDLLADSIVNETGYQNRNKDSDI